MKVKLISFTGNPEELVSCAARLCYSNLTINEIAEKSEGCDSSKFVKMLMDIGHESPIEHATFTFGVENVSRVLLAQLTRHRIASFSVQSQRYVVKKNFSYVIPEKIEKNDEAKMLFLEAMDCCAAYYEKIFEVLKKENEKGLNDENLSEEVLKSRAEKESAQDARFVLPGACSTNIIFTMNARSLLNFFKLRCCERAQWEIRELAYKMLEIVFRVAPSLFEQAGPNCVRDGCKEGKMSCGRFNEVKEKIKKIKNLKVAD